VRWESLVPKSARTGEPNQKKRGAKTRHGGSLRVCQAGGGRARNGEARSNWKRANTRSFAERNESETKTSSWKGGVGRVYRKEKKKIVFRETRGGGGGWTVAGPKWGEEKKTRDACGFKGKSERRFKSTGATKKRRKKNRAEKGLLRPSEKQTLLSQRERGPAQNPKGCFMSVKTTKSRNTKKDSGRRTLRGGDKLPRISKRKKKEGPLNRGKLGRHGRLQKREGQTQSPER